MAKHDPSPRAALTDTEKRIASEREVLRRLLRYLFRYKFRLMAGAFLALLVSLANLLSLTAFVPIFNAMGQSGGQVEIFEIGGNERKRYETWLVGSYDSLTRLERLNAYGTDWKVRANDRVAHLTPNQVVFLLCGLILPVYLFKLLCLTGTIYCIGTGGLLAVRDLRMELYEKINFLSVDYFERERTGLVMSRVINDVELVGKSLSMEFTDALTNVFYIVTHLLFLALISWKMLFVVLFVVPLVMSPVNQFASRIRRAAKGQQERLADLGAHIQEVIAGIRVIRAFSMERFEFRRFRETNSELTNNTFRGHYYHQVGPALTEFVATVVVLAFLVWGAWEIVGGNLTKGHFFAFFFTLIFVMRPLKQVSIMVNLMATALAAARRVFDMLDEPVTICSPDKPSDIAPLKKEIEFRNVTFRYSAAATPALRDISFTIRQGETLSLVGSSGAGKTTLMDLLPRFHDPQIGAILYDGCDIREFDLTALRRSIGVVTQSIFLFNSSVRENLCYGLIEASYEQMVEAAEAANIHSVIRELPQGYETQIGERGVMLSGGQRQRLAIARAILADPPLLIFDEATSALDTESEQLVQQAMERLLVGRTVFIIAHRLSTIYKSSQILVLDQGRIVERGSHDELLSMDGYYKNLYDMQFQGKDVAP